MTGAGMIAVIFDRLEEDLALVEELLALVPPGSDAWRPSWPGERPFSVAELAAHLAESAAGLCACCARLRPDLAIRKVERLGDTPAESAAMVAEYRQELRRARLAIVESDLTRTIPTYFVRDGEPFLGILLTNGKHLNHHAHQLFTYLKLLGVAVNTRHLYRFR